MSSPFSCPKCEHGWLLSKEEIDRVSKHLPLVCRECGNEFDLIEGFTDIITTDNIYLQYTLRSNHSLIGESEIIPGQIEEVNLSNNFSEIHKIFLTSSGPQPIYCKPIKITNSKFLIISSKFKGRLYPEKIQITWTVYGNKYGVETPLWRQLLSNAKGYEIDRDFRMEIVELETAFEVFLIEFLKQKFEKLCTDEIIELIFDRFHRMEDITKRLFKVATGETLREMLEKANRPKLYDEWNKYVKARRDKILHRGEKVNKREAKKAFETVFKTIVFIEPMTLNYLYHSFEAHKSVLV